jgi:hypothetical protein
VSFNVCAGVSFDGGSGGGDGGGVGDGVRKQELKKK